MQYGCDSLCASMTVSDRQLARLVHVVATVQGFARTRGGSATRHTRCSEADGQSVHSVRSVLHTLCNPRSHTLRTTVPVCVGCPAKPLSARPVTVRCGLLWGIYAPAFALNAQCVGSIPSDTTPLMANRQVSSLWVTFPLSLIGSLLNVSLRY